MTVGIGLLVGLAAAVGCSGWGWASRGLSIADRAAGRPGRGGGGGGGGYKIKRYVDVMIDGNVGSRDKNTGDILINQAVNASPSFKFTLSDAEDFGTITSVILNIHLMHPDRKDQPFDASYVLALASKDNTKPAFKPDMTYYFSKPIEGVKVIYPATYKGEKDGTVRLPANSHFCMTVSVQASRAETARVMFETK
jgi:hypothetical protein